MQPKPILLMPTIAQIEQLRADFFKRLEAEGAPCEGMFEQSIVFFQFFLREFSWSLIDLNYSNEQLILNKHFKWVINEIHLNLIENKAMLHVESKHVAVN